MDFKVCKYIVIVLLLFSCKQEKDEIVFRKIGPFHDEVYNGIDLCSDPVYDELLNMYADTIEQGIIPLDLSNPCFEMDLVYKTKLLELKPFKRKIIALMNDDMKKKILSNKLIYNKKCSDFSELEWTMPIDSSFRNESLWVIVNEQNIR